MITIGEIYIFQYPFTDASGSKPRPVLVLSENDQDCELLFITSIFSLESYSIQNHDLIEGRFTIQSHIKYGKGMLVKKTLLQPSKYIGRVTHACYEQVLLGMISYYGKMISTARTEY